MEGFDEKLERILSSPETMGKIAALAGELSGKDSGDAPEPGGTEVPDLGAIVSAVSSMAEDRRISVLKALKAQTDGAGAATVDRAILAIRIAKTVKAVLPEVGVI